MNSKAEKGHRGTRERSDRLENLSGQRSLRGGVLLLRPESFIVKARTKPHSPHSKVCFSLVLNAGSGTTSLMYICSPHWGQRTDVAIIEGGDVNGDSMRFSLRSKFKSAGGTHVQLIRLLAHSRSFLGQQQ